MGGSLPPAESLLQLKVLELPEAVHGVPLLISVIPQPWIEGIGVGGTHGLLPHGADWLEVRIGSLTEKPQNPALPGVPQRAQVDLHRLTGCAAQ